MRKLLLAILGLHHCTTKLNGYTFSLGYTGADVLKNSYYKHADRRKCFCGGAIIPFILNSLNRVFICECCEKKYYWEK